MAEYRDFNSIDDITQNDVAWLKEGAMQSGPYFVNERHIRYTTKRGVRKSMTYFGGYSPWRSVSESGTLYDRLTTEEARVFAPEVAEGRDRRKSRRTSKPVDGVVLKVGDVLYGSGGYEARIYDFFEVTRVSLSGKTCWVRRLKEERNYSSYDEWECRPKLHEYEGSERRHAIQYYEGEPYIRVNSYMRAWLMPDPKAWFHGYNYH